MSPALTCELFTTEPLGKPCAIFQILHVSDIIGSLSFSDDHLVWSFIVASMLLQMALLHFFLMTMSVYTYTLCICTTAYLSIHLSMEFRLLPGLGYCRWCCHEHRGVHISFQIIVLPGYMPRSGIAGSYGNSSFSFPFPKLLRRASSMQSSLIFPFHDSPGYLNTTDHHCCDQEFHEELQTTGWIRLKLSSSSFPQIQSHPQFMT